MLSNITIRYNKTTLFIYVFLALATLAVYWQASQFDFVSIDDGVYVTENYHIQSGLSPDGLRWALSTTYAEFWHPLTWISLMLDYHLFGLNAGGYHMTNLILHMLSTLLLFRLFHRMTGAVWKSAFVAAFFALHPLHVESVAWVAERKDVLSGFLFMLTLCLYVYYTEKPVLKRYLSVCFFFILALMSKSIVVTLPVLMILLDYWPLKRFQQQKNSLLYWQLKEKWPLFMMAMIFAVITVHAQPSVIHFPFSSRLLNAFVSFISYVEKTFLPYNMAVFYPFPTELPVWLVIRSSFLIITITLIAILMFQRLPSFFVGWMWYTFSLLPVIGIIQVGNHAMADRYHYLPSIGIAIMLAWGIPFLMKKDAVRKKIVPLTGFIFLMLMAVIAWKQCGYWKNNFELFNHAVLATRNNDLALNHRGVEYGKMGRYQLAKEDFRKVIIFNPNYEKSYYNLGKIYADQQQFHLALEHYNTAIKLKPDYADAYYNIGIVHFNLGQYQEAIDHYNKAIRLKPAYREAFNNRGAAFFKLDQYMLAIRDFTQAISIMPTYVDAYYNRGLVYRHIGRYKEAVEDFSNVILLKPDCVTAYYDRGDTYKKLGQPSKADEDIHKANELHHKKSLNKAY